MIALATGKGVLHCINYGAPVNAEIQARIQGNFNKATLLRPEAPPKELKAARRGTTTEVYFFRSCAVWAWWYSDRLETRMIMQYSRREFLRTGALAAAGAAAGFDLTAAPARLPQAYFGVHPFIEANPKAVFIRRTHVPHKMDEDAKRKEGLALAREIFVPMDRPGIPISHRIVLKPNCTSVHDQRRPDVENWGTGTDPQFYEGMVMGLKELGLKKFHFVEANNFHTWNVRGFVDINERLGIEMNECQRRVRNFKEGYEMTWSKVPDAVVYSPHSALRSGERAGHLAAEHRQVEGPRHVPDAVGEERAGAGGAALRALLLRLEDG